MRKKPKPKLRQKDLFRPLLTDIINDQHPLVKLADKFDWQTLDSEFGLVYQDTGAGRPALDTRLVVGLNLLKYMHDESDESIVERFVENPYYQYFCGMEYFEHKFPCHPTSLTRWRQRFGEKGC